ncbi:transposase [Pseudomonas chlororaphis subsp. aurantiaca]|uniref:Mu transposase C-terminal domain-containing protein n=1 Tax=Pseudomonas chlororaphis TaxID=587753 RepID=UPI0008664BD7|nr:Mu transposase C-terminal domain-containing protein [Pseudomonas chlororaphis]BAV75223.1 Mu transposase/integrase [Pseudomonas chlororaphis subsp. aurantiaca]BBN55119.1 transposase [Pseudomonas chlororaphis subsp. aurantiaca]
MRQVNIESGVVVLAGNKQLEIIAPVSLSSIQAKDILTGEVIFISPGEIECELKKAPVHLGGEKSKEEEPPLAEDIKEADLQLASERFSVLSSMLGKKTLSKQDIAQCTAALGLSASQVRRLFSRLDMSVGPLSLVQRRRGRAKGVKLIAADIEGIIQGTIDECYAGPGATYQRVIEKVTERCLASSIPVPSAATISCRIRERNPRVLLTKKSGTKAARQAYEIRGGKIQLEAPLELIQIDHAQVDCIIVDSEQRLPLMRPWVTIAIDVYTRVVLGFYLSLSDPSAMSVALCIAHSILPKGHWLRAYGFNEGEYPFYGVPKRIHVDNAKEFRSQNLSDSCRKYGIELTYRPKGTPHNGGHIERLIGTLMRKVHMLPGTTMSSAKDKGRYRSDKHAALSFSEFREWFIREVEIYHATTHSELNCSPLFRWEEYYQDDNGRLTYPPIIENRMRLLIDFMPVKQRVIGRAGVRLNTIDYYSPTLKRFNIGTKCVVRYDPESLRKVWVLPSGEQSYIELSYADLRLPNATLSEFKRLKAKLKEQSEYRVPPAEVFALMRKNEVLVNSSVSKSKQVRKAKEREKNRTSDSGHPLNERITLPVCVESVDYSVRPKLYEIEF